MDDEGEVGFVQFRRTLRYFCSCTLVHVAEEGELEWPVLRLSGGGQVIE